MRLFPLVWTVLLGACAERRATPSAAAPCNTDAAAAATTPLHTLAPADGAIFMRDSGSLHVFALAAGSLPLHEYIDRLPANFALGDDASAPTLVTVLEPLRFDALTLFPAYYLEREIEYAPPKVTLASGVALHRVERLDAERCGAYVGFGNADEDREFDFDGGRILGQFAPELELGPVEVPCSALGGASAGVPALKSPTDAVGEGGSGQALRLTPIRDEQGAEHYEAIDLKVFEQPTKTAPSVGLTGNEAGSVIVAGAAVILLDKKPDWKKVRLIIGSEVAVEGWVEESLFEPDDGTGWEPDDHGRLGGGRREGPPPTFCTGTLAAGTPIFSTAGVTWATVAAPVEGAFERQRGRLRLVNFFGKYRDSFCEPGWHPRDTQGIADCMRDAEVRAEDLTLHCPASAPNQ